MRTYFGGPRKKLLTESEAQTYNYLPRVIVLFCSGESITSLVSGLQTDPPRQRNPAIAHAPVRTPNLRQSSLFRDRFPNCWIDTYQMAKIHL
jgi:hypothetical protein